MNINVPSLFLLAIIILSSAVSGGQSVSKQQFKDSIQKLPYFGIYKDNYFITGVPTNKSIDRSTANAKYQISFKQFITKNKLPWNTYLFMTYTQKSFWNIYEDSFPFRDINFNATISLGKPIFNNEDRLKGFAAIAIDHESNGRDSIFSRSWNRLSASYTTKIYKNTVVNFEAWLPFLDKKNNPDLLEYVGLAEVQLEHELKRNKLYFNLMLRKGLNLEAKGAVRSRIYYNPFSKNISNQYIMLEWYLGNSEGLLNYQNSQSMVRIGYVIKTKVFDFFR